jgi:hypothetical protein
MNQLEVSVSWHLAFCAWNRPWCWCFTPRCYDIPSCCSEGIGFGNERDGSLEDMSDYTVGPRNAVIRGSKDLPDKICVSHGCFNTDFSSSFSDELHQRAIQCVKDMPDRTCVSDVCLHPDFTSSFAVKSHQREIQGSKELPYRIRVSHMCLTTDLRSSFL